MNTRAAIVLTLALSACGSSAVEQPAAVEPVPETTPAQPPLPPEGELTDIAARHLLMAFYADVGEWAGEYAISQIEETRFEQTGPDTVEVHTRYYYRCLLPACPGEHEGHDQRVFYFERRAGRWQVVRMGEHMSAVF